MPHEKYYVVRPARRRQIPLGLQLAVLILAFTAIATAGAVAAFTLTLS